MEVYRIARDKYAKALVASGKAARWNKDNQFVIYTSQSRALSALELIVHRSSLKTALKYEVMVISLPDNGSYYTAINPDDLPPNWRELAAYPTLQDIGANWYNTVQSLILKVPSVIVPEENNFVINLNHPDFTKSDIQLLRNEHYFWDERLLS